MTTPTKIPKELSKCCEAEAIMSWGDDFGEESKLKKPPVGVTCWFVCKKCGKPCDILMTPKPNITGEKDRFRFRGMTIKGEWVYGLLAETYSKSLAGGDTGMFISNKAGAPFAYQVRPETVGQSTALLDRAGKEIFEGDILKHSLKKKKTNCVGEVAWIESNCLCCCGFKIRKGRELHTHAHIDSIEVIGNIHENPELHN